MTGTLNLSDNFYLKAKGSSLLILNEGAAIAGFQVLQDTRNRLQFGIGYAHESLNHELYFIDGDRPKPLNGVTFEANIMHSFSLQGLQFGLIAGPDVTIFRAGWVPSINAGIVVGAF